MRVALEVGPRWVFAIALDWPGWCRRGRGEDGAVEVLLGYADRYRAVLGRELDPGPVEIVARAPGDASTEFGAPGPPKDWDREPPGPAMVEILRACWAYFDAVVAASPAELKKGPRGGGRDRDAMVDHVREAERSYASKLGVRVPPRTPWPDQRQLITATLASPPADARWPPGYAIRRVAWHVLDHAWEMQDRRP